ncbi:polyisoprenoid-binding protein [Corallococcus interemptor]|uniref:Polyisoprenoid-binding protein n=1 Tax=Corallococcus interemptor TaxID=2316720 RepID=A0A3A8QV17_9BACT|nr:YceI family protein [Corallococcus interemptor]RKH70770.1 polyisoprenoid-binding protein [Corallococcus interemptor]
MTPFLKSLALVATLAVPSLAGATAYDIHPTNSSALFSVKHMMVSNVRGSFSKVTGTVQLDEKDLTKSSVEAVIDATTVTTNDASRDEHLRGPDFFDVTKFPTLTFKSTKVEKSGDGLKLTGDLTIRGVKKPVVLQLDGFDVESKDPYGNVKRGGTATTKIARKDFGLKWNAALETGGVAVGEEVSITLEIELVKKQPAQPVKSAAGNTP